jgi:L-lactate dehydrogenase complex protein LldG
MIDSLIAGLRANSCTVVGPLALDDARNAVLDRAHGLVAWNDDVPFAASGGVLTPHDATWRDRIAEVEVGVTGAWLAVAEPATMALAAAPGSPRATSLLPPAHVCVLRASDVVASLADALARVERLPSALTWIGGPSRTGDLEMIITLGVHGPRTLDVVLLDD